MPEDKNTPFPPEKNTPRPVFFKRRDMLIVLGALALAVLALLATLLWPRTGGAFATVSVGTDQDQYSLTVPLDEDDVIQIETGAFPVTLQVQNGAIRFINPQCPDHVCEGFGWLRHEGDWALCAPAGVLVRVEQGDED